MVGCPAASFNPMFTQKHYHGLNVLLITFEVSVSGKLLVVTKPSQCVCFFYIYTKSQRIRSHLIGPHSAISPQHFALTLVSPSVPEPTCSVCLQ